MAFHDDVDDANDANDKTSSEHEFELPFPRRATSSSAAANAEGDDDDSVPIDLNDEFERSELSDGLDQGTPPWAMAPAPDPNQAVQQLDAPDGLSDEQRSAVSELEDADDAGVPDSAHVSNNVSPSVDEFAPKSATAASDDPYQIPVDYTTPDFFASRISRRRVSDDPEVTDGAPIWNLDGVDAPEAASDAGQADALDTHVDRPALGEFPADAFLATAAELAPKGEGERASEDEVHSTETAVEREAPANPETHNTSDSSEAPVAQDTSAPVDSLAATSAGASESPDASELLTPPVRRSMADDELLTWADHPDNQSTGTLSVIEVLEAQLRLRDEEAREFREWETTLRSQAAPAVEELNERAHPEFSDTASHDDDDTAPTATQQVAPEGVAAPPTPAAQLPAWDVPPPSDTWAPAEDFEGEIPFAAHADPTGSIALPVLEVESAVNETSDDIKQVQESAASSAGERAPESELLSLDGILPVPASPSPTVDDYSSVPTGNQFEPSPAFPADGGDDDEIPSTPPPLVEPITAPSTPRANLDEHVSFGDFGFTQPISEEPEAESESESSSDSAAAAVPGNSGFDSPFVFDLDSPPSSVAQTGADPHPIDIDTAAVDDTAEADEDDETQAAVSAAAAPIADSDAAPAAFSFASQETPRYVPTEPLSFDDLLKTDNVTDSDEMVEEHEVNPLDAFLSEPDADRPQHGDPLAAPHTLVDSNPIPFAASAAVVGADRAVAAQGVAAGAAAGALPPTDATAVPQPVSLSTARVNQQPRGMDEVAPTAQRVFSLEESGLEPTPIDRRIGHAARLFWLWFAANSSIVSVGLGAVVFAVGMSLRQSVVAILAGVALSFIPLGLTTLAGTRSGQPTMVISRSTFGVLGNIVPSVVALVARLFWGAVLLWVLASSVAIVLIGSDLNVGLGDRQLLLISLALSFLVALVIAFAGYPLFARIQLILSIVSGVLIVGLIVFTAQYIDVSEALTTPDGSWLLTITGAVLVFSFLGLVWAYSGADIARYQRTSSSGPASALSAAFGATVPAFVLIAYGALLAASDPAIARGFLASPLDTLLLLLPGWYPIPLLLAAALSLLSGITLSLYSGGFALQAMGVRLPRQWSIVIVGVLLGALAILFAFGVNGGINELFRDGATTLAVPTAAWIGIFAAETMIRTRRLDGEALTRRGGIYSDVRWVNLSAFIVISAIGYALTSATISWLSWQGYGFVALGVDLSSTLAATDLGVLVALVLGILTPIVSGIPAIRRQEAGRSERAVRRA